VRPRPRAPLLGQLRDRRWSNWRGRAHLRHLLRALGAVAVAAVLWLVWPYLSLWQLDRLAARDQPEALVAVVDIEAVRDQIRRRLNKDADSVIGQVSDPFIDWISAALKQPGPDALDRQVSIEWLHGLLRERTADDDSVLGQVGWAFFSSPTDFLVRVDGEATTPLFLHLRPGLPGWKVIAAYY
jgi:hypothetical protein